MTAGHRISIDDHEALVEVRVDGRTIASTRRAKVLNETGLPPRYYIPREDVAVTLTPNDTSTHCPFKGDASYWSIKVNDQTADNAVWSYLDPLPEAHWLRDHVALYWNSMDAWFDEDET